MKPFWPMAFALAACAPDLQFDDTATPSEPTVVVANDGSVTIDASSEELWVYFDLASGMGVNPENPDDSDAWDLAFQRFRVKLNGGVSGTGGMDVAVITGAEALQPTVVPTDGYITDEADANGDGVPEYAFDDWYDYDPETHILTAADRYYVPRSVEGGVFELRFRDYYDDAGSPGHITFEWALIQ